MLNWLEYLNEFFFIVILHLMLCFLQNDQLDELFVWDAGTILLGVIGMMFLLNLIYLVSQMSINVIKKAKINLLRRQNLRKMRLSRLKKSKLDEHLRKKNAKNEDLKKCKSMEVSKY